MPEENKIQELYKDAVALLKILISIPSFSREEAGTANAIGAFFQERGIPYERHGNNIIVKNKQFNPALPAILLNSHHDTVKPNLSYTIDPFMPLEKDGKLYGLGSNDAGGSLVSLIATFLYYYAAEDLKYNLIMAATAEEEISGKGGIESCIPKLPEIESAIVGEPTMMNLAIAERGLMVVDCIARGKAGHAARGEGINAIPVALQDIQWIQGYRFERVSEFLGPVRMTVTVINTENKAHNVVPDSCSFVIDIRVNELYSFEEILETLGKNLKSEFKPRSTRLKSSMIPVEHPLVQSGLKLGKTIFGSPTTSDKALMPFPALKMGPGDSARSHTADEFIYLEEIREGIALYIQLLEAVIKK